MNHDDKLIDLLLIEDNEAVVDIFKVLTKKFDLKIKFAKNTQEFVDYSKMFDFHFILCDLHLDYNYEGFFIAQLFSALKRMKNLDSQILLFTTESIAHEELLKFSFDGSIDKNFQSIYNFLLTNFPFKSYVHQFGLNSLPKAYYVLN